MYCNKCGKELAAEDKFCSNCGSNLSETDEKKSRLCGGIWGFLLTFFGSIVCFVVCMVLGDKSCRKAAIITLSVSVGVVVFLYILYAIFFAAIIFSGFSGEVPVVIE